MDSGVPAHVVARLRALCMVLPEAHEEAAWTGTRWRIRSDTFAHVVAIADGWPPAYAKAFATDGPATVLTFQADGDDLEALGAIGPPFYRPPWRPGIVGRLLDEDVDWDEIAELVTDSYCALAPRALVARLRRP